MGLPCEAFVELHVYWIGTIPVPCIPFCLAFKKSGAHAWLSFNIFSLSACRGRLSLRVYLERCSSDWELLAFCWHTVSLGQPSHVCLLMSKHTHTHHSIFVFIGLNTFLLSACHFHNSLKIGSGPTVGSQLTVCECWCTQYICLNGPTFLFHVFSKCRLQLVMGREQATYLEEICLLTPYLPMPTQYHTRSLINN